ncbi:MAG: MMPL family transporter, partial [Solirubrobacteraceae bacterium]
MMTAIARWVLAHKKLVSAFWVAVTLVGFATVSKATNAFSNEFSVPGREGFQTNLAIQQVFHQGGNRAPIVPVVTLPAGRSVASPAVRRDLTAVAGKLARALPGARIASFASTGSRAFVSSDGRTTFLLAYPLPDHEAFGNNTKAAKAAAAALAGVTVAGARVHVSGVDALSNQTSGGSGPGVLLESVLGGLGALVVLGFVFASLLAFV